MQWFKYDKIRGEEETFKHKTYKQSFDSGYLKPVFEISTQCTARCPQCHRTNPDGLEKVDWLPLVQWSLEDFQNAFPRSVLLSIDGFELCGTWGDPVMNNEIYEIVEYIIRHCFAWIKINTNGSIRDDFAYTITIEKLKEPVDAKQMDLL